MSGHPQKRPDPIPESLSVDNVDWKDALKHALGKPKPEEGWSTEQEPPEDQPTEDDSQGN